MESGSVPPHEKRTLTREEIEKWLKSASLREFNIFVDTNHIIYLLCNQLLEKMDEDKK